MILSANGMGPLRRRVITKLIDATVLVPFAESIMVMQGRKEPLNEALYGSYL